MKWLTRKEVIKAAKSKRSAIACSKKHWKQNYTATEEELDENQYYALDAALCALCERYDDYNQKRNNCERLSGAMCPVYSDDKYRCSKEYSEAEDAYDAWKYTNGDFSAWQKAAKAMYDRLCEL